VETHPCLNCLICGLWDLRHSDKPLLNPCRKSTPYRDSDIPTNRQP
jgi:hypothetical protein